MWETLGGLGTQPLQWGNQSLYYFLDCVHVRGGVPHRGGFPGHLVQVTGLGGVSFLHMNAEDEVPRLTGVMFIRVFIFRLNV